MVGPVTSVLGAMADACEASATTYSACSHFLWQEWGGRVQIRDHCLPK